MISLRGISFLDLTLPDFIISEAGHAAYMKIKKEKIKKERRKFLPILGTALLLPLLPVSLRASEREQEPEYKTLLKPDGTAVRVKSVGLKKSKIVRKKISNKELLGWLKKDPRDF